MLNSADPLNTHVIGQEKYLVKTCKGKRVFRSQALNEFTELEVCMARLR